MMQYVQDAYQSKPVIDYGKLVDELLKRIRKEEAEKPRYELPGYPHRQDYPYMPTPYYPNWPAGRPWDATIVD